MEDRNTVFVGCDVGDKLSELVHTRPGRGRPGSAAGPGDGRRHQEAPGLLRACDRCHRGGGALPLDRGGSPQQISARLICDFPDEPEMRVSHETIYRSLFVQARGALRKELTACLRTGRTQRRSDKRTEYSGTGRLRE